MSLAVGPQERRPADALKRKTVVVSVRSVFFFVLLLASLMAIADDQFTEESCAVWLADETSSDVGEPQTAEHIEAGLERGASVELTKRAFTGAGRCLLAPL